MMLLRLEIHVKFYVLLLKRTRKHFFHIANDRVFILHGRLFKEQAAFSISVHSRLLRRRRQNLCPKMAKSEVPPSITWVPVLRWTEKSLLVDEDAKFGIWGHPHPPKEHAYPFHKDDAQVDLRYCFADAALLIAEGRNFSCFFMRASSIKYLSCRISLFRYYSTGF